MSWRRIQNPESIRQAIAECDRLGRVNFLHKYCYGKATKYHLMFKCKCYDPKAILGVACKYEFGRALCPNEVKGAKARKAKLESLGFTIVKFKD